MNTPTMLNQSALSLTITRMDQGYIGATLHVANGDGSFDVACDMYPMRESKWTTTIDNRFDRVGLFASSIDDVRAALEAHGVDASWFDFVKCEAWKVMAPHADAMYTMSRKGGFWSLGM